MNVLERELRLRTDFNSADDDGLLAALPAGGVADALRPGVIVRLFDADNNSCRGAVERIEGNLVYVRPAWETWLVEITVKSDLMEALRQSVRAAQGENETSGVEPEVFTLNVA